MADSGLAPKQDINWKELPSYDETQIKQLLAALPNSIFKAGQTVNEAEKKLDSLKHDLKVVLAKNHLQARHNPELTSNDDRKAWAVTQPDVIHMEVAIIEADGALSVAKLNYERMNNWFTAVRKIANMMLEQDKAVEYTTKYSPPPKDSYDQSP